MGAGLAWAATVGCEKYWSQTTSVGSMGSSGSESEMRHFGASSCSSTVTPARPYARLSCGSFASTISVSTAESTSRPAHCAGSKKSGTFMSSATVASVQKACSASRNSNRK